MDQLDEQKIKGLHLSYVELALWYYVSPIDIIPDVLPGIGFLDDYILLNAAMWLCGPDLPNVKRKEIPLVQKRIKDFLEQQAKKLAEAQTKEVKE